MYKTNHEKTTIYNFDSVFEFHKFITETPINDAFKKKGTLSSTDMTSPDWHGTKTFEEAQNLLLHGWSVASESINTQLKADVDSITRRSYKSYYDVSGGQVSIGRHLAGLPNSMINRRPVKVPEKIVVVNKDISYPAFWTSDNMLREGIEALKIVQKIEATGARVRLNIIDGAMASDKNIIFKVCIKQPDQRFNLSQMSFPLAHPSMLRRISFRALEVAPETTTALSSGYGNPVSERLIPLICGEKERFIPRQINSAEEFIKKGFTF